MGPLYAGRLATVAVNLAGAAGFVAAWWATVVAFDVPPYILPTPAAVAHAFARQPGPLAEHLWVTLREVLAGFALAAVGGVAAGTLLATSRRVEQALTPVLVGLNAAPKVAFAPLLVIAFGFGDGPKIVMVVLMGFLPVVLSTLAGLTSTSAELVELAQSLSASRWHTFTKIRFPAAVPQIMTGLTTAIPLAVVGAVVGELFGATHGLGYVIQATGADASLAFAAVTALAVMSIALYYTLLATERLLAPWVRDTRPSAHPTP